MVTRSHLYSTSYFTLYTSDKQRHLFRLTLYFNLRTIHIFLIAVNGLSYCLNWPTRLVVLLVTAAK